MKNPFVRELKTRMAFLFSFPLFPFCQRANLCVALDGFAEYFSALGEICLDFWAYVLVPANVPALKHLGNFLQSIEGFAVLEEQTHSLFWGFAFYETAFEFCADALHISNEVIGSGEQALDSCLGFRILHEIFLSKE